MRWLISYLRNVDEMQKTYESQVAAGFSKSQSTTPLSPFRQRNKLDSRPSLSYRNKPDSVLYAAQNLLRCDQPNSLKSMSNFLAINPDSFMCDVQVSLRDNINETTFELGDDVVLTCDVYGDPNPSVYWMFGQKPIGKAIDDEEDKYFVTEKSVYPKKSYDDRKQFLAVETNKTSELRIKSLKSTDMGVYTCTGEIVGSNNRKQVSFHLKQVGYSRFN
jgi:hypothetical protein